VQHKYKENNKCYEIDE